MDSDIVWKQTGNKVKMRRRAIISVCASCGTQFKAIISDIKRGKGLYCSLTCSAVQGQKRMREVCPQTKYSPSRSKSAKFAHRIANRKLDRPKKCEVCGVKCKPDAHHDDYAKPFSVRWLCRSCHMKRHYQ